MQSFIEYLSHWISAKLEMFAGLNQSGLLCVLILFTLLCVFLSGLCLLLHFRNNSHLKEMREKMDALEHQVPPLNLPKDDPVDHPKGQLDKEELRTRFEKIANYKREIPEKYRHVAQLEKSGFGVEDIAEILDVSQNEAGQMLSLARLSNIH